MRARDKKHFRQKLLEKRAELVSVVQKTEDYGRQVNTEAEGMDLADKASSSYTKELMAKDTGLREEKCLGELPEGGTEAHRDYNVLPRKSTKPQTADRGQRKSQISNSKSQTNHKFQVLNHKQIRFTTVPELTLRGLEFEI